MCYAFFAYWFTEGFTKEANSRGCHEVKDEFEADTEVVWWRRKRYEPVLANPKRDGCIESRNAWSVHGPSGTVISISDFCDKI